MIIIDATNHIRANSLNLVEKLEPELLVKIRADRTYRMPPNYINWKILSALTALSLTTCDRLPDVSAFIHSYRVGQWWCQDAPIYCLSQEIVEAFDRTDALHKPNIMKDWKVQLPSFMLAIPRKLIYTPDGGEIDYLVVSCSDNQTVGWGGGKWKGYEVKPFHPIAKNIIKNFGHERYFQIVAIDSKETVWTSGTAIDSEGKLIYDESSNIGSSILSDADREFITRIRNLVINILLSLSLKSDSEFPKVTESEIKTSKGFAVDRSPSNARYPRWLGKNYQPKSENSSQSGNFHSSPRSHWRRGHWRTIEPGDNKRWKQAKHIWIEPVLVNP
jgi:hypothetical protein